MEGLPLYLVRLVWLFLILVVLVLLVALRHRGNASWAPRFRDGNLKLREVLSGRGRPPMRLNAFARPFPEEAGLL